MSYEGQVQTICEKGHFATYDCYSEPDQCGCGAKFAWTNSIDDTNCESVGEIRDEDLKKLLVRPPTFCTCSCGHSHMSVEPLYRIPTPEETKAWQQWWDGDKWHYLIERPAGS